MTVPERLARTAARLGAAPAVHWKRDGLWHSWTWAEYRAQVQAFAAAAAPVARGGAVALLGFNAPEWAVACLGAIHAGAVATGIYATSGADAVAHILAHSGAAIAVVESPAHVELVQSVRASLPALRLVVVYGASPRGAYDASVVGWAEFLASGGDDLPEQEADPDDVCSLIYTSGTTGPPKAVELTHANVVWTANAVIQLFGATAADSLVSFLPLAHVAAQMLDVYGPLLCGLQVHYADADALRGTLGDWLREVQPTYFFGVPRVYEKIAEKLRAFGRAKPRPLRWVSAWAKRVGARATEAQRLGAPAPWGAWLARVLVHDPVRRALGLGRCKQLFAGAAPLSADTLAYYASLRLPVFELYGMSECCGPATINTATPGGWRPRSCGRALDGTEVRVAADGEVQLRGPHVFRGYRGDAAASARAFTPDGWLRSGDKGRVDADGFLWITGRFKEILITAGGENVSPAPVEAGLLALLPECEHAVAVGDRRKFVGALLSLREDEATGGLSAELEIALRECGSAAATPAEARACPLLRRRVDAAVARANAVAVSRAAQVRAWAFLPAPLVPETGELTDSLKMRRHNIAERHSALIESLYA